jgi:hypothetical protein
VKEKIGVLIVIDMIVVTFTVKKYLKQRQFVQVPRRNAETKFRDFTQNIIQPAGIVPDLINKKLGFVVRVPCSLLFNLKCYAENGKI